MKFSALTALEVVFLWNSDLWFIRHFWNGNLVTKSLTVLLSFIFCNIWNNFLWKKWQQFYPYGMSVWQHSTLRGHHFLYIVTQLMLKNIIFVTRTTPIVVHLANRILIYNNLHTYCIIYNNLAILPLKIFDKNQQIKKRLLNISARLPMHLAPIQQVALDESL